MSLVRIPAGRFKYDSVTRKVTPCAAQGVLSVKWADDEKHVSWSSNDGAEDEIDLIVFPQDARFDLYRDNIFVLWFQTYEDKYFFWLQGEDKVEEVKKKVQEAIDVEQTEEVVEEANKMIVENQPDQKPKATELQKPATSAKKIEGMKGLQGIIQKLMQKNKDQKAHLQELGLGKFLSGDTLKVIQENATEELIGFLPEDQQNRESLRQNLYSPQIQQAIDNLEEALYSDGAPALFHEMGLDLKILNTHYGTEALLRALVKWAKDQQK